MNVDPANPKMENRDRFVLSKGHAAPALYATLIEKGLCKQRLDTYFKKMAFAIAGAS